MQFQTLTSFGCWETKRNEQENIDLPFSLIPIPDQTDDQLNYEASNNSLTELRQIFNFLHQKGKNF